MNERLEHLRATGHGECLEAIRLIEDPDERQRALCKYVEQHKGRSTKQVRRAQRLLKTPASTPTPSSQEKPAKKQRPRKRKDKAS